VLNKQAPNRQIWLSSPLSGPARFNWDGGAPGRWRAARGGAELAATLAAELAALTAGVIGPAELAAPAAAAADAALSRR